MKIRPPIKRSLSFWMGGLRYSTEIKASTPEFLTVCK